MIKIPALLLDLDTGDIVLDEYNNVIEIDNKTAFEQIIDGIFHCQVGSEKFNPAYGFDLESALRNSGVRDSEMFIEYLVAQALDKNKEKLISSLDFVKATRDGRTMYVDINVNSILNDNISLKTELI